MRAYPGMRWMVVAAIALTMSVAVRAAEKAPWQINPPIVTVSEGTLQEAREGEGGRAGFGLSCGSEAATV